MIIREDGLLFCATLYFLKTVVDDQ